MFLVCSECHGSVVLHKRHVQANRFIALTKRGSVSVASVHFIYYEDVTVKCNICSNMIYVNDGHK